jgi:hypothetical protein
MDTSTISAIRVDAPNASEIGYDKNTRIAKKIIKGIKKTTILRYLESI